MEAHALEALNVMENLVGIPPVSEIKAEITLDNVMERLDQIEKSMPRSDRINFIDRKLHGSIGKLDVSLKKFANTLETFFAKDNHSSRIDNIEDVIDTVGITLSSVKAKKVEAPKRKGPKKNYIPKAPLPPIDTSVTKEDETLKTMEEVPFSRYS